MKILLLNDNPVVNKLVTLSAQKTSDELEVVDSIDILNPGIYDLLVVDDAIYSNDMFIEVKSKITFSKSLYICSRDAAAVDGFSSTIKKPFLPTDLVELFLQISKEVSSGSLHKEEEMSDLESFEEIQPSTEIDEEEVTELTDLDELEEFESEDVNTIDSDEDKLLDLESLDDIDDLDNFSLEDNSEISLDDEIEGLDLDEDLSFDDSDLEGSESVLDDEEAQKVKDLLDETSDDVLKEESEELVVDEELEVEESLELEDELTFDEEEAESVIDKAVTEEINKMDLDESETADLDTSEEKSVKVEEVNTHDSTQEKEAAGIDELEKFSSEELEYEDELTFDEEEAEFAIDKAATEELSLQRKESEEINTNNSIEDEITTDLDELEAFTAETPIIKEELNLERQIENAVEELSEEDLESELDEETLLEIATSEIDDFDSLTSDGLKLAIGEDVNSEDIDSTTNDTDLESLEEVNIDEQEVNSIEALDNLLKVLKDKNIAASLKGKIINISITIGNE